MASSSSPEIEPKSAPKVVKIQRFQISVNVLIQTIAVLAIVAMVNYVSFLEFKRWDFSRDNKYELSSQTKNLLGNLKKPVQAVIFFSSAAEIVPDVQGLLREYELASNRKFSAEFVDSYRNLSRGQELQMKYRFGSNENILILDCDGKSKFINAADMADYEMPDQMSQMAGQTQPRLKAFKGEQAITSALLELLEGRPNKIYAVTGHGEPALDSTEMKVFMESLKRQNIQIAPLNLLNINSVPDDCRALILCGLKKDLSELEAKLVSDYWMKNGRLMVLLDPFAETARLTSFLATQAIMPQSDRVIRTGTFVQKDEQGKPQLVNGIINDPAFVVIDSRTRITKDLAGMSKAFLGATESLVPDQAQEKISRVKVIPLIQSGEGFWGETEYGPGKQVFFDPKKDHSGPLMLAAAVEKGGVEDQRVKMNGARMIVVGNAGLLSSNSYRFSEGLTNDITVNALNWLLDREEISGIAPKEKKSMTLRLDDAQVRSIAYTVMGVIPGIVAVFGLLNWWTRRS